MVFKGYKVYIKHAIHDPVQSTRAINADTESPCMTICNTKNSRSQHGYPVTVSKHSKESGNHKNKYKGYCQISIEINLYDLSYNTRFSTERITRSLDNGDMIKKRLHPIISTKLMYYDIQLLKNINHKIKRCTS